MKDRSFGATILASSLAGVAIYFWLVFFSPMVMLVVQMSVFLAVSAILAVIAWIGYALATTPMEPVVKPWENTTQLDDPSESAVERRPPENVVASEGET